MKQNALSKALADAEAAKAYLAKVQRDLEEMHVRALLEALAKAKQSELTLGQVAACLIAFAEVEYPDVKVKISITHPRKKKEKRK